MMSWLKQIKNEELSATVLTPEIRNLVLQHLTDFQDKENFFAAFKDRIDIEEMRRDQKIVSINDKILRDSMKTKSLLKHLPEYKSLEEFRCTKANGQPLPRDLLLALWGNEEDRKRPFLRLILSELEICQNELSVFVRHCASKLTDLDLKFVTLKLDGKANHQVSQLDGLQLAFSKPRVPNALRRLDITGWNVSDKELASLSAVLPNLEMIACGTRGCQLSDNGVTALAVNCPSLRQVAFFFCKVVTDSSLAMLTSQHNSFRDLSLRFSNIQGSSAFGSLSRLHIENCQAVTDDGLETLLSNSLNLTHLNLDTCNLLTEQGLGRVLANLSKLKELVLTNCSFGTEGMKVWLDTLKEESSQPPDIRLNIIRLTRIKGMNDQTLVLLLDSCTQLVSLHIDANFSPLTHVALEAIRQRLVGRGVPCLREVTLKKWRQLEQADVVSFLDRVGACDDVASCAITVREFGRSGKERPQELIKKTFSR